jgi:hypothetical protein
VKPKAIVVALIFLLVLLAVVYAIVERERPVAGTLGKPTEDSTTVVPAAGETLTERPTPAAVPSAVPPAAPMAVPASASFVAGTKALREQRYPDAVTAFRAALRDDPNNPLIHLALATAYEGAKDWENAYRSMKAYAQLVRAAKNPS